jgi:hypothetical protein
MRLHTFISCLLISAVLGSPFAAQPKLQTEPAPYSPEEYSSNFCSLLSSGRYTNEGLPENMVQACGDAQRLAQESLQVACRLYRDSCRVPGRHGSAFRNCFLNGLMGGIYGPSNAAWIFGTGEPGQQAGVDAAKLIPRDVEYSERAIAGFIGGICRGRLDQRRN